MSNRTYLWDNIYVTPNYSVILPEYDYDKPYYRKSREPKEKPTPLPIPIPYEFAPVIPEAIKPKPTPKPDTPVEKYDLSKGEAKRLRYACSMLQLLSKELTATNWQFNKKFKYNLAFITVTLPAINKRIDDKTMKNKYFKNFIKRLRLNYGLRHYVWKAEAQENGNIHFHLTANVYIHYTILRKEWNDCIKKTGLVAEFYNKWGHDDPNSTDIHSVRKVKNLGSYLIKYMTTKHYTKDIDGKKVPVKRRAIKGKLWNCSESLKYTKRLAIGGNETQNEISQYIHEYYKKQLKVLEYCKIVNVNLYQDEHTHCPALKPILNSHLYDLDCLVIQRNQVDQIKLLEEIQFKKMLSDLKIELRDSKLYYNDKAARHWYKIKEKLKLKLKSGFN